MTTAHEYGPWLASLLERIPGQGQVRDIGCGCGVPVAATATNRLGSTLQPVTAATWTRQFTSDAMGAALTISEFAQRHIARKGTSGRIIGLTSGGGLGFPEEVT